ncbi:MAG: hypothetical protein WB239_09080 [Acidimicrobiia bacterium]
MDVETIVESPPTVTRTSPRLGFIATSALASTVGLVVAVLVDHLGLAVAGIIGGREPILYHNEVTFGAGGSDLVLFGGVVASLIVGIFFLTLYPASRRYDGARITTLWIVLHCLRQGFTQLALIPFGESNAAHAYAAMDAPAGIDLVMAAAGAVGLLSVALAAAPAFLAYAHRQSEISTPQKRFSYTAKLALIPGVAGSLLAVPFFLPDNGIGFVQTLPLVGLFTIATVLAALGTRSVRIGDGRQAQKFSWLPVGWLVFLLLLFQLVLGHGLIMPPDIDHPLARPY